MSTKIIKHTIFDNTVDNFALINPTKPQLVFYPSEETQMFKHKDYNAVEGRTTGDVENVTNYIGATTIEVPVTIIEAFTDFKTLDSENNYVDFYAANDGPLQTITNGFQKIKIPESKFNNILTDEDEIIANGGNVLKKNYGIYYLVVSPKCITTNVVSITRYNHEISDDGNENNRRTIIELDKNDFLNTLWEFETNEEHSGRLFGSIVEVWDSTESVLKQTKIIGENQFNFENSLINTKVVIYPDNIGYDPQNQDVVIGDILKIYPRETFFNKIILEIEYKSYLEDVKSLMRFMLNDMVRDVTTGILDIYDDNGVSVDNETGQVDGTIIQRYQIFQAPPFEIRKKLKNG